MENLIIENKIDLEEEDKDTKFVTMGGKDVHIKHKGENIYLNDILVIGDLVLPGSESEIIFLASVPWMNLTIVDELRKVTPDKVSSLFLENFSQISFKINRIRVISRMRPKNKTELEVFQSCLLSCVILSKKRN